MINGENCHSDLNYFEGRIGYIDAVAVGYYTVASDG